MQLVRQRVREKNQVHAVPQRQLKVRPPMTDMFGAKAPPETVDDGRAGQVAPRSNKRLDRSTQAAD
jgi:hypothetical protein